MKLGTVAKRILFMKQQFLQLMSSVNVICFSLNLLGDNLQGLKAKQH